MEQYDVVIAGASFAGLVVARRLRGRVLLIDPLEIGSEVIRPGYGWVFPSGPVVRVGVIRYADGALSLGRTEAGRVLSAEY